MSKGNWVWWVLGAIAVVALGMFVEYLWKGASGQPASCFFNKLFHGTSSTTGSVAQGSGGAKPSQPCTCVPASAAVCCSQPGAQL